MNKTAPKSSARDLILLQLRHPLKLRVIICLTTIGSWYFFFFMPLGDQIQVTTARVSRERKRVATAREIETLKKALAPYHVLIPAGADFNELMRHVIDHLRSSPLKLIDLKPEAPKDLGPYQTIGIQLALEGSFPDIDAFLSWVESGERHLRVDTIKLDPNQQVHGRLKAQLTLLSLAEKTPGTARTTPEAGKAQPAKTAK
jgi:Tfp pilus assembly protein PilO